MTIVLTLKQSSFDSTNAVEPTRETGVDASGISLSAMVDQSDLQISRMSLGHSSDNVSSGCIGDFFSVSRQDRPRCDLLLRGDLSGFHHLAATHDAGVIEIDGDAGDWLGAAIQGRPVGMSGGRVLVRGNAGSNAGYRMRRGEILIAGDAGDFLAAHQIAGTIAVAGKLNTNPRHLGYAMRRGSVLLKQPLALPIERFSPPHLTRGCWVAMMSTMDVPALDRLLKELSSVRCWSSRGDAAAGGQGEILWPSDHQQR
jgi:formylmethanofuran dehydrogenase subunit C